MPVTADDNLFTALFQWGDGTRNEENFLSKCLVLILNRIQSASPELVTTFLEDLFEGAGFLIEDPSSLVIEAQVSWTNGDGRNTPDIELSWSTGKAYLEVKVKSGVGPNQLKNYRALLDRNEDHPQKFLFLLTLTGLEARQKGLADLIDMEVSWIKVWSLLRRIPGTLEANQAYVAQPAREYCKFLEERRMGVEQVLGIPGPQDAKNIHLYLFLIKAACQQARFGLRHAELGLDAPAEEYENPGWMGWYFKRTKNAKEPQYACGYYVANPKTLVFTVLDSFYKNSAPYLTGPQWENSPEDGYAETSKQLPAEFHTLDQERQLQCVLDWLEEVKPYVIVLPADGDGEQEDE